MEHPKEKWVESAYEVDGPHYYTVLALHILPPEKWKAMRVEILKRLLVTSHTRVVSPGGASRSATTYCCSAAASLLVLLSQEPQPHTGSYGELRKGVSVF